MKLKIAAWTRIRTAYAYRHEPEHLRELAVYYWGALLSLGALIVVCAVSYGAFQLFSVLEDAGNRGAKVPSSGSETTILDRAQLQATLEEFAERRAQYELLKANRPTVADPSR